MAGRFGCDCSHRRTVLRAENHEKEQRREGTALVPVFPTIPTVPPVGVAVPVPNEPITSEQEVRQLDQSCKSTHSLIPAERNSILRETTHKSAISYIVLHSLSVRMGLLVLFRPSSAIYAKDDERDKVDSTDGVLLFDLSFSAPVA